MEPDKHCAAISQQRNIFRLGSCAPAKGKDARLVEFDGLGHDPREMFALHFAEPRLTEAVEDFGNGEPAGFGDQLVEVHVVPADLASEQARDGGLAGAHESDEADEPAWAQVIFHRRSWYCLGLHRDQSVFRCGMAQSITLSDVDCTIEGSKFDFGAARVEGAERITEF